MEHYNLFIDGEFVEAANGDVFETIDPGTGVSFATVAKAAADAEAAIAAARRSFDSGVWSNLSPAARADTVIFADQVAQLTLQLAITESQDAGHVIKLSKFWGMLGSGMLRNLGYYASREFPGTRNSLSGNVSARREWIRREPIGVCVALFPGTFPRAWLFGKSVWLLSWETASFLSRQHLRRSRRSLSQKQLRRRVFPRVSLMCCPVRRRAREDPLHSSGCR